MRRLISIAAFVSLVALIAASAQMRGGGRASGGGHAGFSAHGSFGGHAGGGRAFGGGSFGGARSGMHPGPGVSGRGFGNRSFHQPGIRRPGFHQPAFHGDQGFRDNRFRGDRFAGNRFRGRHFRDFDRNCFGCRRWDAWPWWYAGYYDPYWWWDSGSSYDEDREREIAEANQMNQQSLEEQRMREGDQDLYAHSDPRQTREPERAEAPVPATVLVFHDQHRLEVQNYAIVGQTLWAFAPQRTQKIPLSEIDLPATTKANDERGVDFKVPGSGEGQ